MMWEEASACNSICLAHSVEGAEARDSAVVHPASAGLGFLQKTPQYIPISDDFRKQCEATGLEPKSHV